MLKITENFENGKTVRLRLDGTLSNETFDELTHACSLHRDDAERTIILDMAGVDYMNDQAARDLVNMRSEHLRIINCSPFIATLLETIGKGELGE
jgi:anti-anti-sigma regulatory factor